MVLRIFILIAAMTCSLIIPFRFESLILKLVSTVGFGWVFSSVLLRIIVIMLFFIALKQFFKLIPKISKIKSWIVFVIAILPGFGISFIAPIYITDYGLLNDNFTLENREVLEAAIQADLLTGSEHSVVAFFTTTCPHCMAASERLGTNLEGGQKIKVHAIFPGNESDTDEFLENHNGDKFQKYLLDNDSLFVTLSGGEFPSLFLIDHTGKTTYHWVGDELNYSALDYLKSLEQ